MQWVCEWAAIRFEGCRGIKAQKHSLSRFSMGRMHSSSGPLFWLGSDFSKAQFVTRRQVKHGHPRPHMQQDMSCHSNTNTAELGWILLYRLLQEKILFQSRFTSMRSADIQPTSSSGFISNCCLTVTDFFFLNSYKSLLTEHKKERKEMEGTWETRVCYAFNVFVCLVWYPDQANFWKQLVNRTQYIPKQQCYSHWI